MARSDSRPGRIARWSGRRRPALVATLVVLLVVAGPAAATAAGGSGSATQAGGASCPQHGTPKDDDVNGDGNDDWKVHEQSHGNGELQIWCVDQDPDDDDPPHDEYFAIVWVDESGDEHFVGKCPFGGGLNGGGKQVDDDGDLERLTWISIDRPPDDDGDGNVDDAIYQYYPANNTLIVKHSENGAIVENRSRTPAEPPFGYGNLSPGNTSDDDFFASAEQPTGEFDGEAMVAATERTNLSVAVRDATTDEPLAGANVTVLTTAGATVETLVTSAAGVAETQLPADRYVLDAEGAAPRVVDLRAFSIEVAVRARPSEGGDRVAQLESRVEGLEQENAALRDDVDRLRTDVEALRDENAALRTDVARVERENEQLRENVSALRSEVAAQCERCAGGENGGGSIPGFGVLVAALALGLAAALSARRSPGRGRR